MEEWQAQSSSIQAQSVVGSNPGFKMKGKKEQCSHFGCIVRNHNGLREAPVSLHPKGLRVAQTTAKWEKKTEGSQGTEVPTWSHLKKLKTEVEAASLIMFLLMLASVSFQSSAKSCAASPRTLSKSTPTTKETHLVAKNINMSIILISHFVVLHRHCYYLIARLLLLNSSFENNIV
uniref:Uncharacterized protein n=1 Tax=Pipistrellus kuhlii TaxID=59472 RepID=A0A7J7U9Z2_PIPKU|nr:hypothetical protein mPipKuh1_009159 [Pipistrellus kuhlii]